MRLINFSDFGADCPPRPSWEDYKASVSQSWRALATSSQDNERVLQDFLENHPCLVPGAFSTVGAVRSGHYPRPHAVFRQPVLSGLQTRRPDFMWLAIDSSTISPVLVEIEVPAKRWFRQDGKPHHELTAAQDQLAEWKVWFSEPANQAVFRDYYRIPDTLWRRNAFEPVYVLVHGSRDEFRNDDALNKKRRRLARDHEYLITFDHLTPEKDADGMLCVEANQAGVFNAVIWPARARLAGIHDEWRKIQGIPDAIASSKHITDERRACLLAAFPQWQAWIESQNDPGF